MTQLTRAPLWARVCLYGGTALVAASAAGLTVIAAAA